MDWPAPRCTVGLLTWNGGRDAAACARTVLAQTEPGLEIVWVDNASEDETVPAVRNAAPGFPPPHIMGRNLGFCGGHNEAFRNSRGKYYLALNQDAFLSPDYIRILCDWMDEDPDLAVASGMLLWGDAPGDHSARIYSAGMAMGHGRFPFELGRDALLNAPWRTRRIVPAVTGAAMLIRREAVRQLGPDPAQLFPAEFFAYFEEIDLAMRAAEAGFKCGVEGRAVAWHAERGRGGRGNRSIRAHYLKNHWLLSLRHDSPRDWICELPGILRGEALHYLPQYALNPAATLAALGGFIGSIRDARRFHDWMRRHHPEAATRRAAFYADSRRLLLLARSNPDRPPS